ncbi:MAG: hypothetical protein K0S76_334 [Herbinix sp.]|jgi:uncharacterized protein with PQ loop repeat|nr:hypothetical protein [Herbinix sp.]
MKLIDRYVYAVTEYLPKDIREDVGRELRANIEDMLPENYTEKDVYQVLEELGSPWKLANEYNPKKRYLIGPGYYDKYISVLKMVIGICVSVFAGIAILDWAIESPSGGSVNNLIVLSSKLISAMFEGAIQGALWVTLVFFILERTGVDAGHLSFYNSKWTPEDLPVLPPNNKRKISRGETIFSMFFTILFVALICVKPQLIAIYDKGDDGNMDAISLFDIERLQSYMIIFFLFAIIELGIYVWKYIAGSWNMPLAVANAIYNVVSCILLIIMLSDQALFNSEFFHKIVEYTNGTSQKVTTWIDKSKWVLLAVIVIICIADSISAIVKCLRRESNYGR